MFRWILIALILALAFISAFESIASGAEDVLPSGDRAPVLKLETGGPRSNVNSLAFSPDGRYLYAAGWDKLVQIWNLNDHGRYEYNSAAGLRVPAGAGNFGGLNAMTVSEDGHWLAVAGIGHARDLSGERNTGWIVPSGMRTESALFDEGMIYVFNLQTRETTLLRGHKGPVQALTFVRGRPNSAQVPPELVSIAEEPLEYHLTKPEIRLWSVQQSTTLATLSTFPNLTGDQDIALPGLRGFRPGLTAWNVGAEADQVEVALAWGDNQFRVWDVRTGKVAYGAGGDVLLTVLPLSEDNQRFLTGAHGHTGVWSMPPFAPGRLNPQAFQSAEIPEVNNKQFHLPRAAAMIRGLNGTPESVGLIVTQHLTDEQGREIGRAKYRLLILSAAAPVKTIHQIELWEGAIRQPSLAVTRDGQTIAVAGNPQNEIHLFKIRDLIAGNSPKPEIISSSGLLFKDAVFVRDGERWGIKLGQAPRDISGNFPADSLLLDISERRIEQVTDKWRLAEAVNTGWSSNRTQTGGFNVIRPGKPDLALKLEKDYQPLAIAFCPPSQVCPIPLVAVASHLRGQPLLQILDGDTGSPLRWCEGHTERIRSLGFSEDGRMLLSVADDRTVAIWTVADLVDRVLKKRGRIGDLVVRLLQDQLVVSDAGSSALQNNDVVLSISSKGRTLTPTTSKDFYRFVLECVPGDQVDVTVRRNRVEQVVACRVEQAIDESKPLFSLFVAPSGRAGQWEWIGWHPLGNFDFRGDRVEHQLGWQFNTGDPLHPAAFATFAEYRDKFVRPGLLQSLIAKQKLELANAPAAVPQIKLSLRYKTDAFGNEDYDAQRLLIKSREVFLVAEMTGIVDRRVRGLNVTVDSAPPIALTQEAHREWIADLSSINWERGVHQIAVKITTPEGELVRTRSVQFQPRSPSIQWEQSWDKVVSVSSVNILAQVTPTNEPIHVELTVQPPGKGSQQIRAWDFSPAETPLQITADVELEPGESLLRLEAWNIDRHRPDKKLETEYKIVPITRASSPQVPQISALAVSVERAGATVPLAPTDEYVFRSSSPVVRISGLVQSSINIDGIELIVGDAPQDLPGFQPGKESKYSIDKQVTLQPGRREIVTIRTMAGNSVDVRRLELEYVPAMPSVASLTVVSKALRQLPSNIEREPMVFYANYDENPVTVTAALEGEFDRNCTCIFVVNDQPLAPMTIRPGETELTTSLQLADGPSFIELQVKVPGAAVKSRPAQVIFRRPPTLGKPQAAAEALSGQIFTLLCDAKSTVPLRNATLMVDGQQRRLRFFQEQDNPGNWLLNFTGQLALPDGNYKLQVIATNDDGDSIEPAVHEVRIGHIASPPVLEVLSSAAMTSVDSVVEIEFKVRSTSPAEINLDVWSVDGKVDQRKQLVEHTGDDRPKKALLQLAEGMNTVTLTAYSKGGSSEKQILQISYMPPPMAVDIVDIDGQTPDFDINWAANQKELRHRNKILKSLIPIQGRVSAKEALIDKSPLYADIWVNSFKLPTVRVRIDPSNPRKATFTSKAPLSLQEQNLIQVKIIGKEGPQPSELGKAGTVLLDCENPIRDQTLYLLLLGTGDAKLQEQQVRKSLAVNKTIQPGVWRSDHFSEIHVLNAMNENVFHVQGKIAALQGKMDGRLKAYPESAGNTIVIVLFQGQLNMRPSEFRLKTDELLANRDTDFNEFLSGRLLESQLNKTYGAHLFLLDLQQQSIAKELIWSRAPHLGILISNWNSFVNRPAGSRLIADLRAQYPRLIELAANIENKRSTFAGQLEIVDRLQSHYGLRFGTAK